MRSRLASAKGRRSTASPGLRVRRLSLRSEAAGLAAVDAGAALAGEVLDGPAAAQPAG
jgi:hypothetical protein